MKKAELANLEANLRSVFDRREDFVVDDGWVVVGEDELMPGGDPIEDFLYGEDESANLTATPRDSVARLEDALANIEGPRIPDVLADGRGPPVANPSAAGGGRPGTPGALRRRPDQNSVVPPPDCHAFYLPWHYFTQRNWGIYLLVEGIEEFGRLVHATAYPGLSAAEARKVAKTFLFHHEAYHNAVETFAVRLEVTHREPCYKSGFQKLYQGGFAHCGVHEEGLATAYAVNKVRTHVFAGVPDPKIRQLKRQIAAKALTALIGAMPPEYASALKLLPKSATFNNGEQLFQECAHAQALPAIPGAKPTLWAAALHSMGPSLQRNRSFSYLIRRSHPAVRDLLSVRYLSVKRKDFLQRLRAAVGGEEVGGGRHPKWQASSGKKVPVPTGTDLNPYTCAQILKQLGLPQGIREFMQG